MSAGYFPAWRQVFDPSHDLAPTKRDPASRLHAWLDICQLASHKDRETRRSGPLKRGELVVSLRYLSDRWKWPKTTVERFLLELKTCTRIGIVRGTHEGTVYRVVKYDDYAIGFGLNGTQSGTQSGTDPGQIQESNNKKRTTSSEFRGVVDKLWTTWLEELGGSRGKPARFTQKRNQKLSALYTEQLKDAPDPVAVFRKIMTAVKQSEWHMSKREYQTPESLFVDENRRDRWVQLAINGNGKAKDPTAGWTVHRSQV